MKRIAVYGAGGFGREVKGMLESSASENKFAGFLDDYEALGAKKASSYDDIIVAIADPSTRRAVLHRLKGDNFKFSRLIAADVALHRSVNIGKGSVVCSGVKITVDVVIRDFVIINLNCTIGHDAVIEDFASIMPSVNISGNVSIGYATLVGSGATILQGIKVGHNAIIGAGSVVTKDVPSNSVVMGVPARIVKRSKE